RRRIRLDQVHQFLPRLRSSKWRRQMSCRERCGCKGSRRPQRLKPRYGLPGRSLRWFPIQRWQTLRVDSFCAFVFPFNTDLHQKPKVSVSQKRLRAKGNTRAEVSALRRSSETHFSDSCCLSVSETE